MSVAERDILTVTEINERVRALIEGDYPDVSVLGEVSNFKRHSSGHLYMTLKDSSSQLRTVCFKRDAVQVDFDVEDGMQVVARGRLTLYEPYGQYQLVANTLEPAGAGDLERAFRALCEKLQGEGLFGEEHKRKLPDYPARIAVITSPTGAAVKDIVSTIKRRWPCVDILLMPVRVQGDAAAPEIVHALELVPTLELVDVVILGRGGGSLEDLWAFNEEAVARAIFDCPIPVISAVGHETDVTIADFVADVRAATPTMAGEIAVPHKNEVAPRIDSLLARMARRMQGVVDLRSARLNELMRSYGLGRVKTRIEQSMQSLDYKIETLQKLASTMIAEYRGTLRERLAALGTLSPAAVLGRGYTICTDPVTGKVLISKDRAREAGDLLITFQDGAIDATVKE
jgi:exodeoxyribonuclease VII large subunit